ncbi:TetR/AcrR family transcriptional regulator [Actinomadura sp. ATCC 31491]|uniref:TetR/AcrR family transcriptional regulator n=1 Tax=Actinomadura luzonensis TaxID=2805427 RepID=A0ABT0FX51_9ACTN|nr:TetR/AcrR family transcriptional regulator [Actinomadura luzonensis]MCK2216907.1 TetR/AcrR family transcriptional regulator [Actinomadura luzonensis]
MSQGRQAAHTRRLIRRTLIELVEEKGFADVSVADIAHRAMIDRSTFYRHYRDKDDLVEQIFNEIAGEPGAGGEAPGGGTPDRIGWWTEMFEHFGRHAELYRALLGPGGSPVFAARLRERCAQVARRRMRVMSGPEGAGEPGVPEDLVFVLAANLIVGTAAWWLDSPLRYTPGQMARAVVRLLGEHHFEVLGLGRELAVEGDLVGGD